MAETMAARVNRIVSKRLEALAPFTATVIAVDGRLATVTRTPGGPADPAYPISAGAGPVAVGDTVLVQSYSGRPVVHDRL